MVALEQVTDSLLRTGLMSEGELSVVCDELQQQAVAVDAEQLLRHLTASGKLTSHQAKRVKQGRSGELVLGNYLVLSHIGEGGMGSVFKALHRRMDRVVAIKVIKQQQATPDFIARFHREIKAAARLNHPNVVVAYDADCCELGDYLVMEYVEGTDLDIVIEKSGPLSVSDAIESMRQAAVALDYAHSQGVVHRDIKPANLMRDITGTIKVADLGLARLQESSEEAAASAGLTRQGMVAGTVDYMPPEQAADARSVDHRADIYSLGCTLFYLLTGGPVFTGDSLMSRLIAHREQPPPSLTGPVDGVTPELDAIFHRMVAKRPEDRFQSMSEVAAALEALQRPAGQAARAADETASLRDMSVLIVEQSKLQAGMIAKRLNELEIGDVHTCSSGREAMEKMQSTRVQLVATSLVLPDMTGLELTERIRNELRWSQIGILLMTTAELSPQVQAAVLRHGAIGALRKPFDADKLRDAISGVMSNQGADSDHFAALDQVRVLIADDSRVARRRIKQTLAQFGFRDFTEVEDGSAAAARLAEARFDLVVTDFNMPNMNGYELIAHIREASNQPNVPIIMVTTEFDPAKLGQVYQLGVSAICNKSFEPEMVRNIVIQLFA